MPKTDPLLPSLVRAERCLEIVFPDELSRPTLRWFWEQKINRRIPYRKIGRLIFFDPAEVRRAIDELYKIDAVRPETANGKCGATN